MRLLFVACLITRCMGAAEVVITPPAGAPMAGYYYNRFTAEIHDDLHAKARFLAVSHGLTIEIEFACD
jgi:hypothetical protein